MKTLLSDHLKVRNIQNLIIPTIKQITKNSKSLYFSNEKENLFGVKTFNKSNSILYTKKHRIRKQSKLKRLNDEKQKILKPNFLQNSDI